MNRWMKVWMAFLAAAVFALSGRVVLAQNAGNAAQEEERPAWLPTHVRRLECGDGRQCDEYRLGRSTQINYLWYVANLAVERTLGRRILNDRQWWTFRLSEMQRPLEPRERRSGALPALINASGANEYVSLELLLQLNNGTSSFGRNPFMAPAVCNGRRAYPLRFGTSFINQRYRNVREEVTLVSVERLLPRNCRWMHGISTVDNQPVLIPTSGGLTIGQRIDRLTSEGMAAVEGGRITIQRVLADRRQYREWESRRGVTVESERRRAFDAYVDRALETLESRMTVAGSAAPNAGANATAPAAQSAVTRPQDRDQPMAVAPVRRVSSPASPPPTHRPWADIVWMAVAVLCLSGFLLTWQRWKHVQELKRALGYQESLEEAWTERNPLFGQLLNRRSFSQVLERYQLLQRLAKDFPTLFEDIAPDRHGEIVEKLKEMTAVAASKSSGNGGEDLRIVNENLSRENKRLAHEIGSLLEKHDRGLRQRENDQRISLANLRETEKDRQQLQEENEQLGRRNTEINNQLLAVHNQLHAAQGENGYLKDRVDTLVQKAARLKQRVVGSMTDGYRKLLDALNAETPDPADLNEARTHLGMAFAAYEAEPPVFTAVMENPSSPYDGENEERQRPSRPSLASIAEAAHRGKSRRKRGHTKIGIGSLPPPAGGPSSPSILDDGFSDQDETRVTEQSRIPVSGDRPQDDRIDPDHSSVVPKSSTVPQDVSDGSGKRNA